MRRMSFTQELEELATASEGMDGGGCWREAAELQRCSCATRELHENGRRDGGT